MRESRARCTINVTQQYGTTAFPLLLFISRLTDATRRRIDESVCPETKAKFDNSCSFSLSLSLSLSLFPPPLLLFLSSFHISSSFFFNRGDDNLAVIHRVDKRFLFRFLESTPPSPSSYSIESSRILRHRDSNFKRRLSKRVREEEKIPDDEARRKKLQYPLTDTAYIFNILPFRVLGIFPRISAILIRERYMIPSVASFERWYSSFRPSIKKNYDFTNFIHDISFIIFIASMFRCQKIALSLLYR